MKCQGGFFSHNVFIICDFFFFLALRALDVLNPSVPVKIVFLHLSTKKVINIVEMIAKLN